MRFDLDRAYDFSDTVIVIPVDGGFSGFGGV